MEVESKYKLKMEAEIKVKMEILSKNMEQAVGNYQMNIDKLVDVFMLSLGGLDVGLPSTSSALNINGNLNGKDRNG